MNNKVIVLGLGYIGLPTAALFASNGTHVIGVDINKNVVDVVNRGEIHINEPELGKIVSEVVSKGYLSASLTPSIADVYIIVVPTPFKNNFEPDLSNVESAINSILNFLKPGDLIIIESTSPIGTTENIAKHIFSNKPELFGDIYIAYCPERVLPGNIMFELVNNDRVIGGFDTISAHKAIAFYTKYIKGKLIATNARTAEMCKLVENSYRDIQIAFANEISIICDEAKIDTWKLIQFANMHPRVNILNPGIGVGGHCIAVDPYFIISAFPDISKLISTARNVNEKKKIWTINKINNTLKLFFEKQSRKPTIALLGLTYKNDVNDIRQSPAIDILKEVVKFDLYENIYISDPNLNDANFEYTLTDYNYSIENSDIIFVLVNHKEFINIKRKDKLIINFSTSNIENND
jgi:UDP-N-acetyl-D-mannosaminuronic acid dehydrogenase